MTTEREMLEYAAKACEINRNDYVENGARNGSIVTGFYSNLLEEVWNPLISSADCAAMCAKLGINSEWDIQAELIICDTSNSSGYIRTEMFINHNNDREAAWRYAATMVAAKIGGIE